MSKKILFALFCVSSFVGEVLAQDVNISVNPVKAVGSLFKKKDKPSKEDFRNKNSYTQKSPSNSISQENFLKAVDAGDTIQMAVFLKEGASANFQHTALNKALTQRNKKTIAFLINNGVRLEYSQCLFYTIDLNDLDLFEFLIKNGANPYEKDAEEIYIAGKGYQNRYWWQLKNYLYTIDAPKGDSYYSELKSVNTLEYAIVRNSAKIASSLLQDSTLTIKVTERMLVDAVNNNMTEVALTLLKKGISPNAYSVDDNGSAGGCKPTKRPIIFKAIQNKNIELVKALIAAKVNVNQFFSLECIYNYESSYPIWEASKIKDNFEMVKLLIENGADIKKTDSYYKDRNIFKYSQEEYKYYFSLLTNHSPKDAELLVNEKKANDLNTALAAKQKQEKEIKEKEKKTEEDNRKKALAKAEQDRILKNTLILNGKSAEVSSLEFDGAYLTFKSKKYFIKSSKTYFIRFGKCVGSYSDFDLIRSYCVYKAEIEKMAGVQITENVKISLIGKDNVEHLDSYILSELRNIHADLRMCAWDLTQNKDLGVSEFGVPTWGPKRGNDIYTKIETIETKAKSINSNQAEIVITNTLKKDNFYVLLNLKTNKFFIFYAY